MAIVNARLTLVLIAGICGIQINAGPDNMLTHVTLAGLIVSLLLRIVIYTRILADTQGTASPTYKRAIRENTLNYVVASIVIAIPILLYTQLESIIPLPAGTVFALKSFLKAVLAAVTVYVTPIVFLRKEGLFAVLLGIGYFFGNIRKSIPAIVPALSVQLLQAVLTAGFAHYWLPADTDLMSRLPVLLIFHLAITYLSFVVFAVAAVILLDRQGTG